MRSWIKDKIALSAFIVLAVLFLLLFFSKPGSAIDAHTILTDNADKNILTMPIQIEKNTYGLAMIDTIYQTIWIYRINSKAPANKKLELIAARSWRYDRLLQQYNTAEPTPQQVKDLLEKTGAAESLQKESAETKK